MGNFINKQKHGTCLLNSFASGAEAIFGRVTPQKMIDQYYLDRGYTEIVDGELTEKRLGGFVPTVYGNLKKYPLNGFAIDNYMAIYGNLWANLFWEVKLREALVDPNKAVIFVLKTEEKKPYLNLDENFKLLPPKSPSKIFHGILGRGIRFAQDDIPLENSWSIKWGDKGFCYLDFDKIKDTVFKIYSVTIKQMLPITLPMEYTKFGYVFLSPITSNGKRGYHPAVDYNYGYGSEDLGKPIRAFSSGKVVYAKNAGSGWGNLIVIEHLELSKLLGHPCFSRYAHNDKMLVKVGDFVANGQQIATCGKTGTTSPHSHFEIWKKKLPSFTSYVYGWSQAKVREYFYDPVAFFKEHGL